MLKVQAVTLRSKLTSYLGGRCQLQSLGRPLILGCFGDGENAGHDPYGEGPPVRGVSDRCGEDGQQICRGNGKEPGAGL